MKKLAFLALLLLTYYVAALYRSPALAALCVAEGLVFLSAFLLARYFKRGLVLHFPQKNHYSGKGETFTCAIQAENRGRLPVNRFCVKVRSRYAGHRRAERAVIYGGLERNSLRELTLPLEGKYCGLLTLRLDWVRAYDYLSLFRSRKRLGEEMTVAVFPAEYALRLSRRAPAGEEKRRSDRWQSPYSGGDNLEVRQLREYLPGDSSRHIHWNQSARTEQLWVKEYEEETDLRADILLDLRREKAPSLAELDAFYEVLSALVLGLLEGASRTNVRWLDPESGAPVDVPVRSADECRQMLLSLYRLELGRAGPVAEQRREPVPPPGALTLSLSLALQRDGQLLYRFSPTAYRAEIAQQHLVI